MNYNELSKMAEDFQAQSLTNLRKTAKIQELSDGKFKVLSPKGKNLGTYKTKELAQKRVKQLFFFTQLDHNQSDDSAIDLSEIDELSYSAIMRKLNEHATQLQMINFMKLFKKEFDHAVKNKLHKPEKIALQKTLVKYNKLYPIKLDKKLLKNAAVAELGSSEQVGKYLADIVRFTLNRISPESRQHSLNNLKTKLLNLNENELAQKHMPASSSIGQSIAFVKNILLGHDAIFIKEVLSNISKNL